MKNSFIIDDEQPAIDVIECYIKMIPGLQLVGTSTNPLQAIERIRKLKVDIVFLDIQMDEMNGIDVMKQLDKDIKVIFCTAFSEFAVTSYDLDATDYLMKPIAFERFSKAVQKAIGKTTGIDDTSKNVEINDDYIFVKAEHKGKMIKIDLNDISFIEGRNNYVAFQLTGKTILSYFTLRDLEERLPGSAFIRVHKSYIVAIKKIVAVENASLKMVHHNNTIPLSPLYREAFMQKMEHKLMN